MKRHDMEFIRTRSQGLRTNFRRVERRHEHRQSNEGIRPSRRPRQSPSDLNHALQTTLLVASNEYKYVAEDSHGLLGSASYRLQYRRTHQVFLNLIVTAAHAIHDASKDVNTGEIRISTAVAGESAVSG